MEVGSWVLYLPVSPFPPGCQVRTFSTTLSHQDMLHQSRPKRNKVTQPWTETFETMSQAKLLLIVS